MSRKSFIITALIINLTICLTLCIVLFTDKNRNYSEKESVDSISDNQAGNTEDGRVENNENGTTPSSDDTDNIKTQSSGRQDINEGNSISNENQTTAPAMTSLGTASMGTTAVINSSCNIRLTSDVSGNVIGIANVGESYRIEPTECDSDWIAIYLEDGTLGYISKNFCSIS